MGRGKKRNISGEEKYNTYNSKLYYCGKGKKKKLFISTLLGSLAEALPKQINRRKR